MNNRFLIVIGVAGLMLTLASSPADSSDSIPDSIVATHIVDTEALRVRFSPSASGRIAVVLYSGDAVQLLDTTDTWSRVAYDSNGVVRTGWTASRFIVDKMSAGKDRASSRIKSQAETNVAQVSRTPITRESEQAGFVSTHIVNADSLRVRYTPDKYSATIVFLKLGEEVNKTGSVDNWSRISYASNGGVRTGWVLSNQIAEKFTVGQDLRLN